MTGLAPDPFRASSRRASAPQTALLVAVAALVSLIAAGCGCKPRTTVQPLDVTVQREPLLNDSLIRMVLFAARDSELSDWQTRPASELTRNAVPDEYKPDLKRVFFTADGENERAVLTANDAIWRQWAAREAWNLVVVADVAGGDEATKRQVFTIDACDWEKRPTREVKLYVSPQGMSIIEPRDLPINRPQ